MIDYNEIESEAKLLGVVFYHSPSAPDSEIVRDVFTDVPENEWPTQAPEAFALIREGLNERDSLDDAYAELFIGPNNLMAPPWGSVYLDKENLMNGDSTMALKDFLKRANLKADTGSNEPEDHIGLMFFMVSWFAANGDKDAIAELLTDHLLSWAFRYFVLVKEHSPHSFYKGAAVLGEATLKRWAEILQIRHHEERTLYL